MLPKMVKNDNKMLKYCKNGKMLTKMLIKCEHVSKIVNTFAKMVSKC